MNEEIIVSTHVGKCAGSTFREILFDLFGQERVLIDHSSPGGFEIRDPFEWYPKMLAKGMKAVHGHTAFLEKWKQVAPDAIYVAWVRNPVDRVLSKYYYEKRLSGIETDWPPDFDDLLEYCSEKKNWMVDIFIPLERVDEYSFIGITETFDKCLDVFFDRFVDGTRTRHRRENINPLGNNYMSILPTEIMENIQALNHLDMDLYHRVVEKWRKREYE